MTVEPPHAHSIIRRILPNASFPISGLRVSASLIFSDFFQNFCKILSFGSTNRPFYDVKGVKITPVQHAIKDFSKFQSHLPNKESPSTIALLVTTPVKPAV